MLQTVCMSPELLVHPTMSENEICGYSPGQGSPLPGETASPKSCFQQSPSLPDSGLTELNVASPKIYHPPPPPCKPPGMPAPAGKRKIFIPISYLVLFAPAGAAQCAGALSSTNQARQCQRCAAPSPAQPWLDFVVSCC